MPYYNIENYKVYLSHKRGYKLDDLALAHKDRKFRSSGRHTNEASELRFQYLSNLCRQNPEAFFSEWVEFNLRGREAQDNAWDLLYDYCHVSGIGYLADLRTKDDALMANFFGDTFTYPMGRVFALKLLGKHTIASRLGIKPRTTVTLKINTFDIVAAYGTIEDFRLQFHLSKLHCGKLFRIEPVTTTAEPPPHANPVS